MLNLDFTPFPELTTPRLVLRQLTPGDARDIFLLRSDEEANKLIDRPKATTVADALHFIHTINDGIAKSEWIYWGIQLINEPKLAGTICYWNIDELKQQAEIGYELNQPFQGKGIMQEAIQKIIVFGFESMHLEKITAFSHGENKNSIKLLKKKNFTRDQKLEQEMSLEPGNYLIFSLSKTSK